MYKPRKNNLILRFFSWYIDFIIGKDFSSFAFNNVDFSKESSVLLLSNHFSWWDGFLMYYINRKHFKKNFYVLVTEKNYTTVKFLKYLGAFASKKGGRSIIETLEFAESLLEEPDNLLLFFPQGKLKSNHLETIDFEKGVGRIVKTGKSNFQIIFASTFIDYFDQRKPTAYTSLSLHKQEIYESVQVLKNSYNQHYRSALKKQKEKTV